MRADAVSWSPWFDESLVILEDCYFFLRLASGESRFAFVDEIQARVRHHGDNLTEAAPDLASPVTLTRQFAVHRYLNLVPTSALTPVSVCSSDDGSPTRNTCSGRWHR